MFKVESYITPIILSYVNRYINNFRPEDSQVSLWGGEATFHNLELNLQVLEQELQLPLSFVSGNIRELLIQVPWTKIASEPITITINTIECILNLKGRDQSSKDNLNHSKEKQKKPTNGKEVEAPPGYLQSLINKIVSNIRIHCNNVILKYVEEDIVLSVNVKLLKFESANEKWEPAYTDLSPAQVFLRKVITVNDLTLCLDKRNASGKIEVYQEPMLYRCSMVMHLLRNYHSATANRASTTRLDIYCNNMEFSMTEQQVPMVMRLLMLLYALHQRQLKSETNVDSASANASSENRDLADSDETWTGWAWSYVSSVLPTQWDEEWNDEDLNSHTGHTLHFGFYVDKASINFKVSETSPERGYYAHKKLKYWPLLSLQLQGIYSETIMHGLHWFNAAGGISQATLMPIGLCSCSYNEVVDSSSLPTYLKIGSTSNFYKANSLFDAETIENNGERRLYNTSWDVHMMTNTESVLLERTAAFAFDYVYQMELPSDVGSDFLSDIGSNLEFSNLSEISNIRICVGPFKLRVCSGLLHRINSLQVAASFYDYQPYYVPKPDPSLQELLPPSAEDFDALSEFIPSRSMRITFFAPVIEIELMDHPFFQATKGTLFRKAKKISTPDLPTTRLATLPKITIECQFFDISMEYPMYVNRLVHTTCQLPEPPMNLFNACYSTRDVKIVGLCSRLVLTPKKQVMIVTPSGMSYSSKNILKPHYWVNSDIPHTEITFESECITINGTKAKMMVVYNILEKLVTMNPETTMKNVFNSSLLQDASKDFRFPHMEVCVENIRFRKITTNSTVSIDMNLGSIKAFIFETTDSRQLAQDKKCHKASKEIQQVLFLSGPELKPQGAVKSPSKRREKDSPLFTATVQFPLNPNLQKHPPILIFNLQEIKICIDPLLCKWLLYAPKYFNVKTDVETFHLKNKNISEASGSVVETPRRLSSQIESVHSSSEREPLYIPPKNAALRDNAIDLQERIYNELKTWFDVWKGMLLCGDVSQCIIYFPMVSLSAIGSQGIQEAVEQAINKPSPPDVMVITLPFANIRSAQRQSLSKYLKVLPVSLPESLWTVDKSCFPWMMSISELSCYTIQFGNKFTFLKPVSLSATVGLSTRPSKEVKLDGQEEIAACTPHSPNTTKIDIGYLGICIHIDMTPIAVSTSEVQVYLFASIIYGLMEVASNLLPTKLKPPPKTPELTHPVVTKGSSTFSQTMLKENTLDSASGRTSPSNVTAEPENDIKLTAWIQWTITRFTIELLSNEFKLRDVKEDESLVPSLKLVLDAEDIVSSLDFQSVYLKIKSKVGSVSIQHYKRNTPGSKWTPGPFSGVVMRLRDDLLTDQSKEDNGFINITITRASCQHTHTLWGAVQKRGKDKNPDSNSQFLSKSRYISEIVVNVQPIDFVISMKTLKSFYLVLVPLLDIPVREEKQEANAVYTSNILNSINNNMLPLAYLECQDIRIIMPSVDLGGSGYLHDVIIFQVQRISLSPTATNPLCRVPLRPDIYEQASHARILNIPGSEIEDRQYQLDLMGISICTGTWEDIDSVFSPSGSVLSTMQGLSENPALEWNNLEKGQPNVTPILNLWNVTEKFDISFVIAPAMVYKDTVTICGHAMEVNFVTDNFINLSLHQIKLVSAILAEFILLIEPLILDDGLTRRSKIKFPYSRFDSTHYEFEEDGQNQIVEVLKDSGIETSDIKSIHSGKIQGTISTVRTDSDKQYVFPRPPNPLPPVYTAIPIEILFTAGKIGVALYQMDVNKWSHHKQKAKKKKHLKMADDDLGYDGSEESVDEKSDNLKKYVPLVYICVNQPNVFISVQQLARRIQISCFDLNLKLSGPEYLPVAQIPTESDFPVQLLETKCGTPDPNTGVIPAFFTLKYFKGVGKNANLEIILAKPTKILCKLSKWGYLMMIKDKVSETFRKGGASDSLISLSSARDSVKSIELPSKIYTRSNKYGDTYSKFQEIKEFLRGTNSVILHVDQLILALKSDTEHEINVGMQKLKSHLTLSHRPEKLNIASTLDCISITVMCDTYKKLLLNPWTITFDICVFWESWQNLDSDPQIQINVESDCIMVDVTSEEVKCVEIVLNDIKEFLSSLPFTESNLSETDVIKIEKVSEKDQHYKDDLRAGAFQFVDSNTENTNELPLPYQVMFWNKNISAMAWRYPQPRALTKVRVFPVPYKMALSGQEDLLVLCHLEYWSECRNSYLPFTQFYLSESEVCHLTLPDNGSKPVVATTWRVIITTVNEDEDSISKNVMISPRALGACMRIDSYFNRNLIPNINAALHVTKVDISLYSYCNKTVPMKLPKSLKHYTPDLLYPENQRFLTLTFDNLTGYFSTWNFTMISTEFLSSVKCNVLDYEFLTEQALIEPFTFKIESFIDDYFKCNVISKPINVKFGPSIAHTLVVSSQIWEQNYKSDTDKDFIIMSKYVICNDTNVNIRFGQTSTDEDVLLSPKHCHLYSWRSHKKKQQLKVALEENDWIWSKSFAVYENGTQIIHFNSEKNLKMLVTVKSLSATQKQIIISGQLTISNLLCEHFELKVVDADAENKDVEFKSAQTYIIAAKTSSPSIFVNSRKRYFLRLRFYGLDSAWTGDIPLREHGSGSQPWLVKVPLQERGQFLSIWCRIVIQEINKVKRYLVMLWPLFMVKSNLPISAKVHIETPVLKVQLDSVVKGKGEIQQLYCPGTIDHSHQLTFQLDNENSSANPYVPLNYSLVDQQKFFKKSNNEDIDEILEVLENYNDSKWPYFRDDLENIEWIIDDQPLTHVQVRYQNACQYSCALLVELLPWCLIANTLGTTIGVMLNGVELCRVQHHGIVTPPKIEENFNLGIQIGGSWYFSGQLQLAKSDWSTAFYMPKISGTIPLEGSIKTAVKCEALICMVLVTSSISNEIRLLRVSSTHVLSNHLTTQMHVLCFCVPNTNDIFNLPPDFEKYSFTVAPHLQKSHTGISIIQWHYLGQDYDPNIDYALYMSFSITPKLGWSCPIRVDKCFVRKSFSVLSDDFPVPMVLTAQEGRGQIFLAIHNDPRPQILVQNKTNTNIYCAQFLGEANGVAVESTHFNWHCKVTAFSNMYYSMPVISDKFPELPQTNFSEKLSFSLEADGDFQWSIGISITNDNEYFVRIPYYGDVQVVINNRACTTMIRIESVSQVEISAKDIRVRLSMHELANVPLVQNTSRHIERSQSLNNDVSPLPLSVPPAAVFNSLPTVVEQSNLASESSNVSVLPNASSVRRKSTDKTMLINTIPIKDDWKYFKLLVFVKSFTITLMSDLEFDRMERWELAAFNFDNIGVDLEQKDKSLNITLSVAEFQFDNQLFSRESFDFPVVLTSQERTPIKKMNSLNVPIEGFFENLDESLLVMSFISETWKEWSTKNSYTAVKCAKISINPISCFIEDIYVTKLMDYMNSLIPTKLVVWPEYKSLKSNFGTNSGSVSVPDVISWQCAMSARPLTVRNFAVEPLSILLSIHSSVKMYIALDQSPLQFSKFEKKRLYTTAYRLGHTLTMHYLSGAIFGAGWVVSSLELLGSPGGLARAMGIGLRDFVSMPYRGLVQGPMAFLWGISQGSASLMKHVTAGTLQSVTKLASSVARNLDRLTLDEEHVKRTEEQRRQRPQGVAQGFMQGLTGLGISLLGAVGGIAHHPLQSMMSNGASPRSLATGVGLGLVGVLTKPLSGAAELVALTGQGLLQGAGWNCLPEPRSQTQIYKIHFAPNSILKYNWKLMNTLSHTQMLYVMDGTSITGAMQYDAVALILTVDALIIIDVDKDETCKIISLNELTTSHTNDPTLLILKLQPLPAPVVKSEDELMIEMDPACRARVADYVRSTVELLNLPDVNSEHSDISISPLSSPGPASDMLVEEITTYTYYVNPQCRNYFLCLLSLAKRQSHKHNFPVL